MKPTAFARLLLLLGLSALALSACGGETTTKSQSTASPTEAGGPAKAQASAPSCRSQLGGFLAAMGVLRHKLEVGLSYEDYVVEVARVRAAYDRLPADRLAVGCLIGAGTPGERAFNEYIAAANAWGECLSEPGCRAATVEGRLQDEWEVASHFLSLAQRRGAGPVGGD